MCNCFNQALVANRLTCDERRDDVWVLPSVELCRQLCFKLGLVGSGTVHAMSALLQGVGGGILFYIQPY